VVPAVVTWVEVAVAIVRHGKSKGVPGNLVQGHGLEAGTEQKGTGEIVLDLNPVLVLVTEIEIGTETETEIETEDGTDARGHGTEIEEDSVHCAVGLYM
jgi:hypothetical protein